MSLRTTLLVLAAAVLPALLAADPAAAGEHRLGVGAHYYVVLDDLEDEGFDDIDEDGLAGILSYQYVPGGLLRFGIDLEYFPGGFGGSEESATTPIVWAFVGSGFYAGVGAGVTYSSDFEDDVSDVFYAARLGFDVEILAGLRVDVHANYRADAFDELDQASTDAITLGAIVRFTF